LDKKKREENVLFYLTKDEIFFPLFWQTNPAQKEEKKREKKEKRGNETNFFCSCYIGTGTVDFDSAVNPGQTKNLRLFNLKVGRRCLNW
jgi:hypothetical protein